MEETQNLIDKKPLNPSGMSEEENRKSHTPSSKKFAEGK